MGWPWVSLLVLCLTPLLMPSLAFLSPVPSSLPSRNKLCTLPDHALEQSVTVNKGMRVLEFAGSGGLVPQQLLVKTARFAWSTVWKLMMQELAPQSPEGDYVRPGYGFTATIGEPDLPVESGRYHVFLGNACPWCHRISIAIALRGLSEHISLSYMSDDPERASRGGWAFTDDFIDPVFGCSDLREVYETCSPGYTGRCTAPLVVDKTTGSIVSNESSDIVRMLNNFDLGGTDGAVDLCPSSQVAEIDSLNDMVYNKVNNAVYRCGFATAQEAYDRAYSDLKEGLKLVEERLSKERFMIGEHVSEVDVRLLPTILRFDAVYATLFKCSGMRIKDYPHLHNWLMRMYALPGVAGTFDLDGARRSYYEQLFPLNPGGIVPGGPSLKDLGLAGMDVEEHKGWWKRERSPFLRKG
ncbi:unnamed protein product [Chrysoparadoxa australica]